MAMAWFKSGRSAQGQTACEKLVQLGRKRFGVTLNPAELQVINDTANSLDLPSPEEDAPRPEGGYNENTPRLEVRATFLSWLATDLEARVYIYPKGLRVYSSKIIGDLDLGRHSQLPTIDLRRCTVEGKISLEASEIKGLRLTDCFLSKGIEADGVVVHGPVLLYRTQSRGEIRFINASIESNLECQGAKLILAKGDALTLDGATIKGDVFLQELECRGEIRMLGTKVDSSVMLTDAVLFGENFALSLDKARIGSNLLLNGKLQCIGTIRMPNCRIEGNVIFIGSQVDAVFCDNTNISMGTLAWCSIRKTPETRLCLRGANVRTLIDDKVSWPDDGKLELENLTYTDLILHKDPSLEERDQRVLTAPLPFELKSRIAWLNAQSSVNRLRPQPWIQLSRYLESTNNKIGAKHVLYKFRCVQAHESWWLARRARIAFAWLEETPARITYFVLLTLFLGTLIFVGADRSGAMISTARDKDGQPLAGEALKHYPQFQPFIYTLENAVPLVKLGVDDKWTPDPAHRAKPWFPQRPQFNWLECFNSYCFLTISRWMIILFGWFQAAVLGATLTSRFKS
jgi:hypothetical protein